MTNLNGLSSPDHGIIEAVLEGGPADIPEGARVRQAPAGELKIKVQRYGGYEHFERADEPSHEDLGRRIVFRWTMRTAIAE